MRCGLAWGAVILLAVLRPWRAMPGPGEWRALLLSMARRWGCMNLLYYMSLKTVPIGIAVSLEFVGPLAVAIFVRAALSIFAALAAAGLLLLSVDRRRSQRYRSLGAAYALGAGAFAAISRSARRRVAISVPAASPGAR